MIRYQTYYSYTVLKLKNTGIRNVFDYTKTVEQKKQQNGETTVQQQCAITNLVEQRAYMLHSTRDEFYSDDICAQDPVDRKKSKFSRRVLFSRLRSFVSHAQNFSLCFHHNESESVEYLSFNFLQFGG